jgi:Fic-DOC domain mobile mystery protein B
MELKTVYQPGQAQLEKEELGGLKITGITILSEVLPHETKNITKATTWAEKNQFGPEKIFTEPFLKEIHKRMFCDVWDWAGKYRLGNKTMGVDFKLIRQELKQLFSNTMFWIENESYDPDEIAIRFMHRLLQIQCFPDGNARHAQLMADIVSEHILNGEIFTWGSSLNDPKQAREKFLDALKKADKGKMDDLLKIARI